MNKKGYDPMSMSVLLYDIIDNTDLETIGDEGWEAYKRALKLLEDGFTLKQGETISKTLVKTGWKTSPGFEFCKWEEVMAATKKNFMKNEVKEMADANPN